MIYAPPPPVAPPWCKDKVKVGVWLCIHGMLPLAAGLPACCALCWQISLPAQHAYGTRKHAAACAGVPALLMLSMCIELTEACQKADTSR